MTALMHLCLFASHDDFILCTWIYHGRAGLVQAVESYRLWPEGSGFESWSSRIAQARVRFATNTLSRPRTEWELSALGTPFFYLDISWTFSYMIIVSTFYYSTNLVFSLFNDSGPIKVHHVSSPHHHPSCLMPTMPIDMATMFHPGRQETNMAI